MSKIYAITYDNVTTVRFTAPDATKADAAEYIKHHQPSAQKHMKIVIIDDNAVEPYAANLTKKGR